jgi:hypothetical protein
VPRPASSIITQANQRARTPGFTAQALDELNSLLDHIARTVDFSAARGQWNFTFNPNLITTGGGNIITTGPNPLPIDYLRVGVSGGSTGSQRSSKWYLQGVAYDMVEIDLTELDDQVQQAGIQSYPYFWAKDMAQYQPVIEVTGDLTANSQNVANLAVIDNGSSLNSIAQGMSIAGGVGPLPLIVPGSTITGINVGARSLTLSAAPSGTMLQATLLIGNPAVGYAWPPPSGAYNAMIRYQRRMPRLTQAQVNAGAYCWLDDDKLITDGLTGVMMGYSHDTDQPMFEAEFRKGLGQYLKLVDDTASRAQTVQLDRRWFGGKFSSLKNTKQVGW